MPRFSGLDDALRTPGTQVRLFGKPVCEGKRRLAVCVAAARMAAAITIALDPVG